MPRPSLWTFSTSMHWIKTQEWRRVDHQLSIQFSLRFGLAITMWTLHETPDINSESICCIALPLNRICCSLSMRESDPIVFERGSKKKARTTPCLIPIFFLVHTTLKDRCKRYDSDAVWSTATFYYEDTQTTGSGNASSLYRPLY